MKKLAIILTRIYFKLIYRVEVRNKEYVPETGPVLVCAAHHSILDMFFIGYKLNRWIYWMAKEELFKNPVLAFLLKKLGAFPIKRGKGDVGSIKTAYRLLEQGEMVGIFPQGTRRKTGDPQKNRIKSGAALMAVNTGVQILPATVVGGLKPFSRIRVIFGKPFKITEEKDKKYSAEELNNISKEIMNRVFALEEGLD
jgi:1-acyl-sn-glycerol-3-phosphate acyltransferase